MYCTTIMSRKLCDLIRLHSVVWAFNDVIILLSVSTKNYKLVLFNLTGHTINYIDSEYFTRLITNVISRIVIQEKNIVFWQIVTHSLGWAKQNILPLCEIHKKCNIVFPFLVYCIIFETCMMLVDDISGHLLKNPMYIKDSTQSLVANDFIRFWICKTIPLIHRVFCFVVHLWTL